MDIDTEEPPPLVDVAAEDGMPLKAASPLLPTTEMSDLAISTVPLTIVTGRSCCHPALMSLMKPEWA